ncbi:MAG: VOC family protein [Thermomicrobiales bacterium]|nr:VOC family protein [Thermomicrobiales bacterium]MCO5226326.1 VOC family protein [Thermomicrobiales bacterium]MCO5228830.1 VOC family protein [Thermomicrobiales bacterium]
MNSKYRPCIWFEGNAKEAAEYYAEVFPDVSVGEITLFSEGQPDFNKHMEGQPLTVMVTFGEQEYIFLNGGVGFPPSEYFSIEVMCEDQEEVDLYWDRILADGGKESACGWIKDKFNHDWQITPRRFYELMADPANEKPVMDAMYEMSRLIVADLEAAAVNK